MERDSIAKAIEEMRVSADELEVRQPQTYIGKKQKRLREMRASGAPQCITQTDEKSISEFLANVGFAMACENLRHFLDAMNQSPMHVRELLRDYKKTVENEAFVLEKKQTAEELCYCVSRAVKVKLLRLFHGDDVEDRANIMANAMLDEYFRQELDITIDR